MQVEKLTFYTAVRANACMFDSHKAGMFVKQQRGVRGLGGVAQLNQLLLAFPREIHYAKYC